MLIYCRAPLLLTVIYLTSIAERRLVTMMSLMQLVCVMIEFIHAVGYLNWKHGMFIIRVAQTSYAPLNSSYLNLKWPTVASATRTVLLWWILFYIMSGHTCAFHYLSVWSVTSLILPDHVYECTSPSSMGV